MPAIGSLQVVRDHVGVAAQLGLHAPLLRDVGEEVDQAVAELDRALHERPEHVPVAERRVVGDLLDPRLARLADLDVGSKAWLPRIGGSASSSV